jgi:hypothetical protein
VARLFFVDECLLGPFLGVGGFVIDSGEVTGAERQWALLKRDTFGADPLGDFKWNMQPEHPARIAAQSNGYSGAARAKAITDFIAELPVTIFVAVQVDQRRRGQERRTAFDLYRAALKGLLASWTRDLQTTSAVDGPHQIVLDMPPVPSADPWDPRFRHLGRQQMVAFDLYADVFRSGVDFAWTRLTPLRTLGASSAPFLSHASRSLALQIADSVVGCVTGFVKANVEWAVANPGEAIPILTEDTSLPTLLPKFAAVDGRVWRYGLRCYPVSAGVELMARKVDELAGATQS